MSNEKTLSEELRGMVGCGVFHGDFIAWADRAAALEAENERLKQAIEDGNLDDEKTYRENDALRAQLEVAQYEVANAKQHTAWLDSKLAAVRAVCDGDVECEMGTGHLYVYLNDILAILDKEGSE